MKRTIITLLAILLCVTIETSAHPGSAIVVDRQGNIYFIDTGSGVYKIDRQGQLTKIPGPAYHWIAIDHDNRLASVTLPYYASDGATIARTGTDVHLLLSSDYPITVGNDGALIYPWRSSTQRVQIYHLAPSGSSTVLKTLPASTSGVPLRWINGIVSTADGSVYYTEDRAVRKISPKGELTTVVENVTLTECSKIPGLDESHPPYFRGLDVDTKGTVYVAASGCGAVLKITHDKKVTTILQTTSPWSPTAVALYGNDLYVLEYLHTASDDRREWLPRVRKLSPDGKITTITSIDKR